MENGVFLSGPVPGVRGGREVPPSLCLSSLALSRPRRQRHQRESPLSRRVSTGDERTGPSWHFRFSRRLLNRREGREGWFGGGAGGGLPSSAASAMRSPRRYALCPPPPLLRSVASGRGYPRRGGPIGASPPRKHPRCYARPWPAGRGGDPASIPFPASAPPTPRAGGARPRLGNVSSGSPGGRAGMACDAMRYGGKAARRTEGIAPSRPHGGELQPQPPRETFFFFFSLGGSRVWHPPPACSCGFPPFPLPRPPHRGGYREDGCARRGPRALPRTPPPAQRKPGGGVAPRQWDSPAL